MKIGLSLSRCVADVINGVVKVEDINHIITNTCARDEHDWTTLIAGYCRSNWRANPVRAVRVVDLLRAAKKIVQPRVDDPDHFHSIRNGIWV